MAAPATTEWGSIVKNYGRIGIYATKTSTSTITTYEIEVWFWSKYSVNDTENELYLDIFTTKDGTPKTKKGSTIIHTKNDSGTGWNESNQVRLCSQRFVYKFDRKEEDQIFYAKARLTGINRVDGTMSATRALKITHSNQPATTYTKCTAPTEVILTPEEFDTSLNIEWYGAKDGENNEIIDYAVQLRVWNHNSNSWSNWYDSKNNRPGIRQSPDGADVYGEQLQYRVRTRGSAGEEYYSDWKESNIIIKTKLSYTVEYDLNGGISIEDFPTQEKNAGETLILNAFTPTKVDYTFKGWSDEKNGTVIYSPGDPYERDSDIKLYAVWKNLNNNGKNFTVYVNGSFKTGTPLIYTNGSWKQGSLHVYKNNTWK